MDANTGMYLALGGEEGSERRGRARSSVMGGGREGGVSSLLVVVVVVSSVGCDWVWRRDIVTAEKNVFFERERWGE